MKLVLCETFTPKSAPVDSYSPFCLKVHCALRALGLSYERRSGANPASFGKLNPAKQVPILLVDDRPIRDSTIILHEIVKMTGALVPEDAHMRALAWLWEDYADRAINGYLVAARWASDANWERVRAAYFGNAPWFVRSLIAPKLRTRILSSLNARDVTRSGPEAMQRDFERLLDNLNAAAPASGFWITGPISVADVSLFGHLQSFRTDLTPKEHQAVLARPALTAYLDRIEAAMKAATRSLAA
jgi:glutathione S-transferase